MSAELVFVVAEGWGAVRPWWGNRGIGQLRDRLAVLFLGKSAVHGTEGCTWLFAWREFHVVGGRMRVPA